MRRLIIFFTTIFFQYGCIFTPPKSEINYANNSIYHVSNHSLVGLAKNQIGIPYRYGGNTPDSGFDCSGFVHYVYKNSLNINLPRRSIDQSRVGEFISKNDLIDGDLLFFDTANRGHINHVGIYISDGKFIHASSGRAHCVVISDLNSGFYKRVFRFAKRVY